MNTNEATARVRIDEKLEKSGWKVVDRKDMLTGVHAEAIREYPTDSGPVDYLLVLDGEPIGVVEAKKEGTALDGVMAQALRYAEDLVGPEAKYGTYKVPFVFSSNGNEIKFQNLQERHSRSRDLIGFYAPDSLADLLKDNKSEIFNELTHVPIKTEYGGKEMRYYQKDALEHIVTKLSQGRRRNLLAMATGTGKTFTASALMYHLMKGNAFKRILFLVDRRSLADQTVTALSTFEPEKGNKFDTIYSVYCDKIPMSEEGKQQAFNAEILQPSQLKNRNRTNTFVYVSTIQRLYSMLKGRNDVQVFGENEWEGDDSPLEFNPDIPIDSFDLIISDEAHRSIYNKWKYVLDYFDTYQIGLTATPAAHTAAYFDVNDPDDMYAYAYEKAVDDDYLVDFDAVRIKTDIDMKEEVTFSAGEALVLMDRGSRKKEDIFLDDELKINTASLERKVTVEDRNRKIVKEVLEYIESDQKTIVFAVNEIHADTLVDIFRDELGEGDDVVQKITYSVDKPNEQIRKFRNLKKPRIVVSVDMLTTGVDIPKVENLVFIRPVKSRILYEQMIGRGTRLSKEINKTHFTVFDAVGVIEYMTENGGEKIMKPTAKAEKTVSEAVSDIMQGKDVEDNATILARKIKRMNRNISEEGRTELKEFGIDADDLEGFASSVEDRLAKQEEEMLNLFGDPKLQDFLTNYPRVREGFVISKEKMASIATSEYIFRTTDGRELKPQDYLESFKQYIKKNANEIEALRILLDNPRNFTMKHFHELKAQLSEQPERYTEERLKRANEGITHAETPADLYSFVSYAVWNNQLISPQERVQRAFQQVDTSQLNEVQVEWVEDIKTHLESNIIIQKSDFASLPFSRKGGFRKADSDFGGKIEPLLEEVNEYILVGK